MKTRNKKKKNITKQVINKGKGLFDFCKDKYTSGGIILILIFLFWHISLLNFECLIDDAYISFRYADNFIRGNGLVYNIGEKVEGYTNFLWTIILSGFMLMGSSPVLAAKILGILFCSAGVIVTFRIASRILEKNLYSLIPPLFLICNSGYVLWATGGLETHLFSFLIVTGIFFYLKEGIKNQLYSGCLFALAFLTRPEGILFALLTFLHRLLFGLLERKKEYIKDAFVFFLICSGFLFPYVWFKISYYGDILPNTFYVREPAGISLYRAGITYLFEFFTTNFNPILLILFLFSFIYCFKKFYFTYLLTLILPFFIYILWIGGDHFPCFRFLVPIMPLMALFVGVSFKEVKEALRKKRIFANNPLLPILLGGILAYSVIHSLTSSPKGAQAKSLVSLYTELERERVLISDWFRQKFPPSTSIAIDAAGIIPYYTRFVTIDMLGLNDKHIARSKPKLVSGPIGHLKFDSDYVLSRKPDLIIIGSCKLLSGKIEFSKIKEYYEWISSIVPGSRALITNKRLYEDYELIAAQITSDKFLPLFLSRASKIKKDEKLGIFPVL